MINRLIDGLKYIWNGTLPTVKDGTLLYSGKYNFPVEVQVKKQSKGEQK